MKLQLFILFCISNSIYSLSELNRKSGPSHYTSQTRDAPNAHAPFQCSLQKVRKHHCGCAIISNEYILTAASCIVGQNAADFEVMVGSNEISGGTYYLLNYTLIHDKYNRPKNSFDIAVARVDGRIELNDRVRPIKILRDEAPEGAQVEITGWGRLGLQLPYPTHLQIIKTKILSLKTCQNLMKTDEFYNDDHFCVYHSDHEETCTGDQGNPVVLKNDNGSWLVGVVISPTCERAERSSLMTNPLTKISNFYNWIKSKTGI